VTDVTTGQSSDGAELSAADEQLLRELTGGFTDFAPLSFIPFHTLLGAHSRCRGNFSRREPQAHRDIQARARQPVCNLQASWLKMGSTRPPGRCIGESTISAAR
jgi:hypothetical protein